MKIIPLESGTPRGVSFWSRILATCPRMVKLDENNSSGNYDLSRYIGSIGHTMLAEWYRTNGHVQLRDYRIKDGEQQIPLTHVAYLEAARVYRAYVLNHAPGLFGNITAIEKTMWAEKDLLSIKPDLLTKQKRKRVVVDHKFLRSISSDVVDYYLDGIAAVVYLIGSDSDELIYNLISKDEEPGFAQVERKRRSDDDKRYQAFLGAIGAANQMLDSTNPTYCVRYAPGGSFRCRHFQHDCYGY